MAAARRQVRAVLSDLDELLPSPWNIDELVTRLAGRRGRPIVPIAWDFAPTSSVSGLWIPSRQGDYIFYDQTASPTRREQIIGHELGHILLGHSARLYESADGLLEALAPSLPADLTRRLLARTGYERAEEALAEEFGTRLVRIGATRKHGGDDELGRLTEALR